MRAGAHALSVLAAPLNYQVLASLESGPKPLMDLRRAAGSPPQTTLRGNLRALAAAGVLERHRQDEFPGTVDLELARPGRELLCVTRSLRDWLLAAPEGPLKLGEEAAKNTVKAMVDGWTSGIVRVISAKPHALTELSRMLTNLSYPSLERRLGAMRLAGLAEPCPTSGRGTPHRVTEWMRRAVAPLAIAARWERTHLPKQTPAIRRLDVEAAFLLALPLVRLPADQEGACRLAVEMRNGNNELRLSGAIAEVQAGAVSCRARLEGEAGAWITGSPGNWLSAVIEDDRGGLETGGDLTLASSLLDSLRSELLGARRN